MGGAIRGLAGMKTTSCTILILGVPLLCLGCRPNTEQMPEPMLRSMELFELASEAQQIEPAGSLGSRDNPIRADGPLGQQEFLMRLRCPGGVQPLYERVGSITPTGPDENIIDGFVVHCPPSGPTVELAIDMYHEDYREQRQVGPFRVLPDIPARVAAGCPPAVVADPDSSARYAFHPLEVSVPARLLTEFPNPIAADVDGGAFVSFVIDTSGMPEMETLTVFAEPAALKKTAEAFVRGMRFDPAEHHVGCPVRQRLEGPLEFEQRR